VIEKVKREPLECSSIEVIYDYFDENHSLLFQVVRYDPKCFRERRPDGNANWIWSLEKVICMSRLH
jgi:hypothetical protein